MTPTEDWLLRDESVLAGVLSRVFSIVADSGEGCWLIDVDGDRYLDLTSGIAVTNLGHCHPAVVAAIEGQARRLLHTSVVTHNQPTVLLAERLRVSVPYIDDAQVFFCNTGAETVDGALKLARRATGRPGVIAFRRAFHGRTLAATSLTTAKGKYRAGYEPFLPGVHIAPYCIDGDWRAALAQLDDLLALQAPPTNIGAMIVEPVLGEGGYVVPPVEWLVGLRQRCSDNGILLVFDEVQTGIGRTGALFAAETFGIRPDVILFAKGIASGLPLAGIIAARSVMERWPLASHGTTFGGNPVACAAALATLSVIEDENLCRRASSLGRVLVDGLRSMAAESVREVRGVGLMIGVEFRDNVTAAAVQRACLDRGVLVLTCGPDDNVIRLIPPLTINDAEVEYGLQALTAAIESV